MYHTDVNDTCQSASFDDNFNVDYDVHNLSIACDANVTDQGPRAHQGHAESWFCF